MASGGKAITITSVPEISPGELQIVDFLYQYRLLIQLNLS